MPAPEPRGVVRPVDGDPLERRALPVRPSLRAELVFQKRTEGGLRYVDVKLPEAAAGCSLRDFELELARKMDGSRDLEALVAEAKEAALPLGRSAVEKLVRTLDRHGLLVDDGRRAPLGAPGPVAVTARMGAPLAAPDTTPGMPREASGFAVGAEPARRTLEDVPAPGELDADGENGEGRVPTVVDSIAPRLPRARPEPSAEEATFDAHVTSRGPLFVVAGAGVAVVTLVLLVLLVVGRSEGGGAESAVQSVAVESEGVVTRVLVARGAQVRAGEVLAVLQTDGWRQDPAAQAAQREVERLETSIRQLSMSRAHGLQQAEDLIAQRTRELAGREAALSRTRPSQRKPAQKNVRKAREALQAAQNKHAALHRRLASALAPLEGALAGHKATLEKAQTEQGTVELKAPFAGVLLTDPPAVNQRVRPGLPLFLIASQ